MRAARSSQRQALRHDWVDLVRTQQLQQRQEILPEPIRVAAGTSTHSKRSATATHGQQQAGGLVNPSDKSLGSHSMVQCR
jgi:hypothetical protein